jgi:hypothetical protein
VGTSDCPSHARISGAPRRITNWAGLSLLDLSVSTDGKHLVFVNAGFQKDLFVAGFESKGSLEQPRRLTLEGRNNLPSRLGRRTGKHFSSIPTATRTGTSSGNAYWSGRPKISSWVPATRPNLGLVPTLHGSCTGIMWRKARHRGRCVCCGYRFRAAPPSQCSKPAAEPRFDVHLATQPVSLANLTRETASWCSPVSTLCAAE